MQGEQEKAHRQAEQREQCMMSKDQGTMCQKGRRKEWQDAGGSCGQHLGGSQDKSWPQGEKAKNLACRPEPRPLQRPYDSHHREHASTRSWGCQRGPGKPQRYPGQGQTSE